MTGFTIIHSSDIKLSCSHCTDITNEGQSLMAWILVMAEEIDDQELLLVAINKTVLFQKVVKCFDD